VEFPLAQSSSVLVLLDAPPRDPFTHFEVEFMRFIVPVLLLGMLGTQWAMAAGDGTSALGGGIGGALGNVIGQQMGGSTGAAIGAGVGGAAGGALSSKKGSKTEAAIGGGLGSASGSVIGHQLGGVAGSTIGAGLGGAAGGAVGNSLADDGGSNRSHGKRHEHKKNKHDR
jgi:hypothetical protein